MLLLLAGTAACNNADVGSVAETNSGNMYYDYQIWADEGSDEATVRLQYKLDGEEGRAVALREPGRVLLDSTPFRLDSTKFNGAYYELTKPLAELQGKHTILFTDKDGKTHREMFSFTPFALLEELPEEIPQKPFTVVLKNFPAAPTRVRLVLIDTSLTSAGVNEELFVENGKLNISQAMLLNLTKGPVTMEINREEERPIQTGSGGKFLLNYGLRRQFVLVE